MQYYKCSSAILEMDLKPSTLQVYHFWQPEQITKTAAAFTLCLLLHNSFPFQTVPSNAEQKNWRKRIAQNKNTV